MRASTRIPSKLRRSTNMFLLSLSVSELKSYGGQRPAAPCPSRIRRAPPRPPFDGTKKNAMGFRRDRPNFSPSEAPAHRAAATPNGRCFKCIQTTSRKSLKGKDVGAKESWLMAKTRARKSRIVRETQRNTKTHKDTQRHTKTQSDQFVNS